jgi:hypothetical protein
VKLLAAILIASLALTSPSPLHAQPLDGAQSTFLDPSIAAAGMGRAGSAVFWGEFPNGWANPALLGYHQGVRYAYGSNQLIPSLAEDLTFKSHEITIGYGGLGISLAGKPIEALGHLRLDYGPSELTDVNGNPIGTYDSYEQIDQFGVGLNVMETFATIQRLTGHEPSTLSRLVDLSIGHTWKTVTIDLAPVLSSNPGRGEVSQRDFGALLRVTPIDGFPRDASGAGTGLAWRLQVAAAYAARNYADTATGSDFVTFVDEEQLIGGSARLSARLPVADEGGIWNFVEPTLALGLTVESANYYGGDTKLKGYDITRAGEELALLETLYLRHGDMYYDAGDQTYETFGVGVRLRYKKMIGFTYDWAQVPQGVFFGNVGRQGVTFFVDPLRLARGTK